MNKYILFVILCIASVQTTVAQKLVAKSSMYDCGPVLFNTPFVVNIPVLNNTDRKTKISTVETSCGCIKASYDDGAIQPGKEVNLSLVFDAKLLGRFHKSIFVYAEGDSKPLEITIKGSVQTEVKDLSKQYPYNLDGLCVDRTDVEFDDVYLGATPEAVIKFVNQTSGQVTPILMRLPEYMSAEVFPQIVQPQQEGIIKLFLDTEKLREFGLVQTSVFLGKFAGDKISPDKQIETSAVLLPSISDVKDDNMMPQIKVSDYFVDVSTIQSKKNKVKSDIIIQNVGKSTLDITNLQMFTRGIEVSLSTTQILPTETAKLRIIVDKTIIRKLKQRPRILMITNDPNNPKVIIEIR